MGAHDWYRCKDWTADERATFDAKIARSRKPWSRWQYLHTQATLLYFHGRSADAKIEAVRLLRRSIDEVPGVDDAWAASSMFTLAELALRDGDDATAAEWLRAGIARSPAEPAAALANKRNAAAKLAALTAKRRARGTVP